MTEFPELGGTGHNAVTPPELGGNTDVFPPENPPEHPHAPHKPRRSFILVGAMLVLMAILIGAVGVGVYVYSKLPSKNRPKRVEVTDVADLPADSGNTAIDLSSGPFTGMYGASVIVLNMDFDAGEGTRFYRADPNNIFTLRITNAVPLGKGEYQVEITEFIESRIKVGVYKGVISDSDFTGVYFTTHGDTRNFHLTR